MKKVLALALVAFAVVGFMTTPSFAEALSDGQQNSLEMLLRSFGADDSTIRNFQGAVLGATTGPTDDYGSDGTTTPGIYCPKLTMTLQRGARDASTGGQVTELQLFLSDYFNLNEEDIATGFFGRLSQSYVVKFQQEKGLPSFGIVGSLTRAKISEACGKGQTGTITPTPTVTPTTPTGTSPLPDTGGTSVLVATPNSGSVPLAVQFSGRVNSAGYSIDFGDGTTSGDINCGHGGCPVTNMTTTVRATHTYSAQGTYTAKLRRHFSLVEGNCLGVDCNVVARVIITVGGTTPVSDVTTSGGLSYALTLKGGNGTSFDSFVEGADIGPFILTVKNISSTTQSVTFPNNCWYKYWILDGFNSGRVVFDLSAIQQCISASSQVSKTFTLKPGDSFFIDITHKYQTYSLPPGEYAMRLFLNTQSGSNAVAKFNFKVVGKGTTSNLSCSLTTEKSSYIFGENILVKWNSNGTYAQWIKDTEKDNFYLGGDKLASSGSATFTANVLGNPYLVMRVYDASGNTNTCRLVIPVSQSSTSSGPVRFTFTNPRDGMGFALIGSTLPISWTIENPKGYVYLQLIDVNTDREVSALGGSIFQAKGSDTYNWLVSAINQETLTPGAYRIRATVRDGNNASVVYATADSALFSIFSSAPPAQTNPVVVSSFTASSASVATGQPVTLSWSSNLLSTDISYYGGFCAVSLLTDLNQEIQVTSTIGSSASGSVTYVPSSSGTYTVRCSSGAKDGSPMAEKTVRVTVGSTASSGELYAVGVYEAQGAQHNFCYSKPGTVNVDLVQLIGSKKGTPVTLSLSAYEPVIWNINVPAGVNLQKVILSGYNVQSPVITGASPLVERYFYNDPANAARGISPAGSFYDERDGADSRFQTIYNWAGQATCANTSGAVPIASRWYYNPGSNYFYAYQKTDSNYSTLVSKLQSLTGLSLKNFQGAYSGSTFTVTVGTPEY